MRNTNRKENSISEMSGRAASVGFAGAWAGRRRQREVVKTTSNFHVSEVRNFVSSNIHVEFSLVGDYQKILSFPSFLIIFHRNL